MKKLKQFISRVPNWAYLLVFVTVVVNTLFFIYKNEMPVDGLSKSYTNGQWIIDYVTPNGPAEKSGILPGDILVSVNSMDVEEWDKFYRGTISGDKIIYGINRNDQELAYSIAMTSPVAFNFVFFWIMHVLLFLISIASLFLLYKKPNDLAVKIFFIYLQIFVITQNATYIMVPYPLANAATFIFTLSCGFLGPVLIHFHLLFPKPAKIYTRFKNLPNLFYLIGILFFILYFIVYMLAVKGIVYYSTFHTINRIVLSWLTFTYMLAVTVVVYQFITIKDTLSRNQLRIVLIGSFFGLYTGMAIALFYDQLYYLQAQHPTAIMIFQGIGGLVTVICILIAIFRYRIWDTEILIRKALLYLSATFVITLTYLILIFLVDSLTINQTFYTRFIIMAVSVMVFLVLRDSIQKLIDIFFHRELYDSATVVSNFEEKLAGIYRFNELKMGIVKGLDEIFHFKSCIFNLKKNELAYEPAVALGIDLQLYDKEFKVAAEFEAKLLKAKIFSPAEINKKPVIFENLQGDLVVPLLSENKVNGFFICGPKQSEKTYSLQDIKVLTLLSRRVIALLHTASLYQKDLERQLMLERERIRISQDMHDDVGASLTRISILSELAKNQEVITGETKQWLNQINDTSRSVMEEMNQIIWALNPKNDTMEGLVAYLRHFVYEYLEPTSIECIFELPGNLPHRSLSVEIRRNTYLVVRETLHNIVKHSGATKVVVSLSMNKQGFRINIKDDGKGFDPGKLEFLGNGLVNMKKRMKDINGKFQIKTNNGSGTEIKLEVPLT